MSMGLFVMNNQFILIINRCSNSQRNQATKIPPQKTFLRSIKI